MVVNSFYSQDLYKTMQELVFYFTVQHHHLVALIKQCRMLNQFLFFILQILTKNCISNIVLSVRKNDEQNKVPVFMELTVCAFLLTPCTEIHNVGKSLNIQKNPFGQRKQLLYGSLLTYKKQLLGEKMLKTLTGLRDYLSNSVEATFF